MGFPRQEYWSRLPFSPPGDLPDPEVGPTSPVLAGRFFTTESPRKPPELREGSKGGSWVSKQWVKPQGAELDKTRVSKQWVKPQGAELDKTRVRSLNFVTMAMRSHRGVMMSFVLYTCSE